MHYGERGDFFPKDLIKSCNWNLDNKKGNKNPDYSTKEFGNPMEELDKLQKFDQRTAFTYDLGEPPENPDKNSVMEQDHNLPD